jgi:23S rRNA (cytosine1962-C5)-methyltransferase
MNIQVTPNWDDYQLLDSGNGQRLEKFGQYILVRPDPQVIWKPLLEKSVWDSADAVFEKTAGDRGQWNMKTKLPERWLMSYKDLKFWVKLTPFKHTGVFPEQASQWDFIQEKVKGAGREINILNLFAYTGIASLAAAAAGAKVTHVDASKPAITWLKENQDASNLSQKPIRLIIDDALKFTAREIRRGVKYDGIIMDPPIYGHGPDGEKWDFNQDFPKLVEQCSQILSENPLFLIVNAYAISSSAIMLGNVLSDFLTNLSGNIEVGELALQESNEGRLLSTGIFAKWSLSS